MKSAPGKPLELDAEDRQHNEQGTFLYPPSARNPSQFIDFWENVPVSDEVLRDFERRYRGRRDAYGIPAWEKRQREYVAAQMRKFDQMTAENQNKESYRALWDIASDEAKREQRTREAQARLAAEEDFRKEAPEKVDPPTADDVPAETIPYPFIGRSMVRPLARAGAMFGYLPAGWSEEDREAVLEHRIDLGLNNVMTVRDIENTFRLSEINDYLRG
ncbi:hypothetical protein [Aeromicrobium sp. 179-A 4D2 NHS]|uniref:hypothetical protein n=1 Tax=Aeromicrobium sp. 179-A 4D2 NHS TaxID=3142375 RepID=UPI0039A11FAC